MPRLPSPIIPTFTTSWGSKAWLTMDCWPAARAGTVVAATVPSPRARPPAAAAVPMTPRREKAVVVVGAGVLVGM